MCNCVNVKIGSYDNQVVLQRPLHMKERTEGTSNPFTVCVDRCIAEEIKYLWSIKVITTGCCCGHNIQGGYIGVIEKEIEFMKKLGYKAHINKQDLRDEKNFIPKSHYKNDKLEYYEYWFRQKIAKFSEQKRFFRYLFALGSIGKKMIKRIWVFDPDKNDVVYKRFNELIGTGARPRFRFEKATFFNLLQEVDRLAL